ncbi:MAG: hypothetical protein A2015_05250 [Spirochaetes bacterium GWF1_31_7]|nr:MAG: hypothetical protein A2Y30_15840 [Spirochaetes bacterium GWE1_32_154]OHD47295.1 MAG: hypothetical protein A2Y29_16315 [Spirochaetes bacterium GWE2_31_10]OHD47354.1 MAG: hypothetical protein A2015_05250 [Spirochaetes bacterium GWF1_31_7]HBD92806.1 hypothetical protein [Spirochaetia bacterium]HBI37313.1 hypothetical protein [Spirochaetia bacterium]
MNKENLKYLSKRLLSYLEKSYKPSFTIQWSISKDNCMIPEINGRKLHSKYYALKEANKYIPLNNTSQKIAIGIGCLYHLINYSADYKIIAISDDPNFTLQLLEKIDISKYFNPDNLIICFYDEIDSYFDYIKYNSIEPIINYTISEIFQENTKSILNYLKNNISPKLLEYNTQRTFGKKWLTNSLNNLRDIKEYSSSPFIVNGKAILICGAGPSLDDNLQKIIQNKKELCIIASDTALPILLSHNILPQAVFTMDASPYSQYHYMEYLNNIRIFIDYTSSIKINKKNTSLLFSNFPLLKTLPIDKSLLPCIDTGFGNIGNTIISFFEKYAKDFPIITTGIDFGFKNKKTYSKSSYLDIYRISKNTYLNSIENIDCFLTYKNRILKKINGWENNVLNETFSNKMDASIISLSDSPFVHCNKIINLNDFLKKQKTKEIEINFNYKELYKLDIKNELLNIPNSSLSKNLLSYKLFSRKKDVISEIKGKIISIFK